MKTNMAHLRAQGISFALFDADASDHSEGGRQRLLAQLTAQARANGLLVQKSALVFGERGAVRVFGTPDLVRFLSRGRLPVWTHTIDI